MSLPTTRDYTLIAGVSPVPANLLNTLQDCIIAGKKPATTKCMLPNLWLPGASWGVVLAGYILGAAGAAVGIISLPTEVGDRVTQVVAASFGTGALTVTHVIAYQTAALTVVTLSTTTDVNRAAAWGDFSCNPTAHVMGNGEALYHTISATAANARLTNERLTYDRL